ncbi:MAG TPA: hypothetical protein VHC68_00985 [Candidatus Paceibacterota bacterium]|nr:hypothetical protein [Candidatus Paceibacterota bacterium]
MFGSAAEFLAAFPFEEPLGEQVSALLAGATRAPSTHNSQPWRFKIEAQSVRIFRDTSVKLPYSDPVSRYAHVSIGFLLQHLAVLADALGMEPRFELVCREEEIARVTLAPAKEGSALSPLAEAIFTRRNRRGVFTAASIPAEILEAAQANDASARLGVAPELHVESDSAKAREIGELTFKNMVAVYERPEFRAEMSRWIAPTGSGRLTGLPGYSLNLPMPLTWLLPPLIKHFNMGKLPGAGSRAAIASAPALFGFASAEEPRGWVAVGYAASYAALTLVSHGYDYSVFVATIEYPETRARVGQLLGLSMPLQFFFVAGKLPGSVSWMTPRLPLSDKIMP